MRRSFALLVWLVFIPLVGCAGTSKRDTQMPDPSLAAGPGDKVICRKERISGSIRKRRVCVYESQLARDRDALKRKMSGSQPIAPVAGENASSVMQ